MRPDVPDSGQPGTSRRHSYHPPQKRYPRHKRCTGMLGIGRTCPQCNSCSLSSPSRARTCHPGKMNKRGWHFVPHTSLERIGCKKLDRQLAAPSQGHTICRPTECLRLNTCQQRSRCIWLYPQGSGTGLSCIHNRPSDHCYRRSSRDGNPRTRSTPVGLKTCLFHSSCTKTFRCSVRTFHECRRCST